MWKILDLVFTIWIFGGGGAISLLMLTLFNWRVALGTFSVWLLTVIGTGIWWVSRTDTPAEEDQ